MEAQMQFSLFDYSARMKKLDSTKDTLSFLNDIIDWNLFRPTLTDIRNKDRKTSLVANHLMLFLCSKY